MACLTITLRSSAGCFAGGMSSGAVGKATTLAASCWYVARRVADSDRVQTIAVTAASAVVASFHRQRSPQNRRPMVSRPLASRAADGAP
jgi:hypothetical protein